MSRDDSPDPARPYKYSPTARTLSYFIFASRWLQAPLYLGLIIAQIIYVIVFMVDLWHIIEDQVLHNWATIDETVVMLAVLGLIDVVMIANLLIMVIIGGYETFVSKLHVNGHPDEPEWLSHVNTNLLKVKLAVSIISISSIHLLRTFIEVGDLGSPGALSVTGDGEEEVRYTEAGVFWQVMIHLSFVVSALALALIDRMSHKGGARKLKGRAPLDPTEPTFTPPAGGGPAHTGQGGQAPDGRESSLVPAGAVPVTAVRGYLIDGKFVEA
ncbi:TIGR00645 family protein [Herbiconiux sp. 11R-BC]|uniref:TIGR00645 family protein n=1 Tax=Herbiconiux sp. 11R-BC TaxID=3111637 RepID=UPI003C00D4AA